MKLYRLDDATVREETRFPVDMTTHYFLVRRNFFLENSELIPLIPCHRKIDNYSNVLLQTTILVSVVLHYCNEFKEKIVA